MHAAEHVLVLPLVRAALVPRARDARARAVREAALDVGARHGGHVHGREKNLQRSLYLELFSKSGLHFHHFLFCFCWQRPHALLVGTNCFDKFMDLYYQVFKG